MISLNEPEFRQIVEFVKAEYGINLEKKFALVQARLSLDIERKGYRSFKEYFAKIIANPGSPECQHMIDSLSTNHTFFFREPASFDHMKSEALPELIQNGVKNIRIWSAAASTGQEIYTIAMILDDALSLHRGVTFQITGSDINQEVLQTAREAVYPVGELAKIPSCFHARYCVKRDKDTFEIARHLRDKVSLHRRNLALPFGAIYKFHLIFCRNVMIYFGREAKERLTKELHRAIYPGGYLYVGGTETVDPERRFFRYVKPSVFARIDKNPENE